MKKLIVSAVAALSLMAVTSCSATEIELEPTAEEGKCVQKRTKKTLGIRTSSNEYIINC